MDDQRGLPEIVRDSSCWDHVVISRQTDDLLSVTLCLAVLTRGKSLLVSSSSLSPSTP